MAEANGNEDNTGPGNVSKVKAHWRVFEDGALAHGMQEQEFSRKYEWNKQDRKIGRIDVPVAKFVHTEEEARKQREELERIEEARRIAEEDEKIAQQIYKQLEEQEAMENHLRAEADAEMAKQVQQDLMRQKQANEMAASLTDEEYARHLQDREERRLKERALSRAQKQLENDIARQTHETLSGYVPENSNSPEGREGRDGRDGRGVSEDMQNLRVSRPDRLLRYDGKVEDLGDFSDFYIMPETGMDNWQKAKLQEIQDEELARLLQDQEHKRGAFINRDKLKAIEAQDEELAKIIYEKEKLRLKKLKQKQMQKQLSQSAASSREEGVSPDSVRRQASLPVQYSQPNRVHDTDPSQPMSVATLGDHPAYADHSTYADHPAYNDRDSRLNGTDTYLTPRSSRTSDYASSPASPSSEIDHRSERPRSGTSDRRSSNRSGENDTIERMPMERQGSHQSSRHSSGDEGMGGGYRPTQNTSSPQNTGTMNAFASIDPTFREPPSELGAAPSSPSNTRNSPTGMVGLTPDDNYCELDTIQQAAGIVSGQKRNTTKKKSTKEKDKKKSEKDKNCKQQ